MKNHGLGLDALGLELLQQLVQNLDTNALDFLRTVFVAVFILLFVCRRIGVNLTMSSLDRTLLSGEFT